MPPTLFHIYPALRMGVLTCINRDVLWALVWLAPDAEGASSGRVGGEYERAAVSGCVDRAVRGGSQDQGRAWSEERLRLYRRRKADDVRADRSHAPRIRARPAEARRRDWRLFSSEEIREHLARIEREDREATEAASGEEIDDFDEVARPEDVAAELERYALLKELLTAARLGTA